MKPIISLKTPLSHIKDRNLCLLHKSKDANVIINISNTRFLMETHKIKKYNQIKTKLHYKIFLQKNTSCNTRHHRRWPSSVITSRRNDDGCNDDDDALTDGPRLQRWTLTSGGDNGVAQQRSPKRLNVLTL